LVTESDRLITISKIDVGTLAQWRAAGVSDARLTALVRSGQLVRLRHGVYATGAILAETGTDPGRRHALQVAAVTAGQLRGGVASHHSAAMIHGIDLLKRPPDGIVTLTVPPGTRTGQHRRGDVIRHAAELPAEHEARRFAVPVTTAARTVADLARTGTFMEAVVVADCALHRRVTTKTELRRVLERCERWPGVARARRVIDAANMAAESVLESCARVVFHEHGLPRPELQVTIGRREFAGRVDFLWREQRTIAEAGAILEYKGPAEAITELNRDRLLREAGYEVVHFTWQELFRDPGRVVARVRYAFRRTEGVVDGRVTGAATQASGRS
jgi:very-short-patch-repair endonuclease